MNNEHTKTEGTTIDEQVSARYAMLANEVAPPELDRKVLRQAAVAAQSTTRRFSFMDWARPMAFAATGVLCITLILNLNDAGIIAPPAANVPAGVLSESLPDNTQSSRTAADTANALRREKSAATVSSKVTAPEPAIENNVDATSMSIAAPAPLIDQAAAPIREDASLDYIQPEVGFTPGPNVTADNAAVAEAVVTDPLLAEESAASRSCQPAQKADPEDWWLCIAALRNAGMGDLADEELESLQAGFPAFELPQ